MFRWVEADLKVEVPRLPLTKFTVVTGHQGSGKSTVLRALALLADPDYAKTSGEIFECGDENGECFLERLFSLGIPVEALVRGAGAVRGETIDGGLRSVEVSRVGAVAENFKETINTRLVDAYPSFYTDAYQLLSTDALFERFAERNLHVELAEEIVVPATGEKYTDVLAMGGRLLIRKEGVKGPEYIDLANLGGVGKALVGLLFIEEGLAGGGVALWDNFGDTMSPALAEAVIRWLAGRDYQVVLATHSLDVISAAVHVMPPDLSFLVLSLRNGRIHYKAMDGYEVEDLLDGGLDPRKVEMYSELQ